ncbi:MAG: hypothetical protein ABSB73_09715 [Solirubrobacteraceae bacterium]
MTLIVRGSNRRKGSAIGKRADGFVPVLVYRPVRVTRQGIKRQAEQARPAPRPLSDRQLALLALLDDQPRGPTWLGRKVGCTCSQAESGLHVLAARGWTRAIGVEGGR